MLEWLAWSRVPGTASASRGLERLERRGRASRERRNSPLRGVDWISGAPIGNVDPLARYAPGHVIRLAGGARWNSRGSGRSCFNSTTN